MLYQRKLVILISGMSENINSEQKPAHLATASL